MSDEKRDANDVARENEPEGLKSELDRLQAVTPSLQAADVATAAKKKNKPGKTAEGDDDEEPGKRPDYNALALDYLHAEGLGMPGPDCGLVYWKEDFYYWTGTYYQKKSNSAFNAMVTRFLQGHSQTKNRVSKNLIGNVVTNLIGQCFLDDEFKPPIWKDGKPEDHKPNFLAVKNGFIDVEQMVKGNPRDYVPLKSTPRMFITQISSFEFRKEAPDARWRSMLDLILPKALQAILQEAAGYSFTMETAFQFFVILHGEAQTGKSAFLPGLKAALGESNYCELQLAVLQSEKTSNLVPLINARANVIEECDEVDKVAENLFKILTGRASVTIDRKFKESLRLIASAKWWLATNERPHFKDRSNAIYRRMIVVPFRKIVAESERIYGMDKPGFWERSGELCGIFLWFMDGLKRVLERGRMMLPEECETEKEIYKIETQPERRFLLENYIVAPNEKIHGHTLYESYTEWLKDEGHTGKLSKDRFGRQIKRVFPSAESKVFHGVRHWIGLKYCANANAPASAMSVDEAQAPTENENG